ncbi:MAG: Ig-like domain-containing protein [Bacillota bacterium]|nr:Ig-like domain-containing protein [Bacillota bacterium]
MKIFKSLFTGAMILVLFLGTYLNAFAASGGGSNPLNYLGAYLTTITDNVSTPGDDVTKSSNIGVNPTIELQFSLNVAGSTVWSKNKDLIKLMDSNGNNVSITVWQIYNDNATYDAEKRNIFIQPDKALNPGEQYTISIDGNLIANNGVKLTGGTQYTKFTVSADTTTPAGNGTSTGTDTSSGTTGTDTNNGTTGTDTNNGSTSTVTSNGTPDTNTNTNAGTNTTTSTGTTSSTQPAAQTIVKPETTTVASNQNTVKAGEKLPNTATNMFNMLVIGILFIAGGFIISLRNRKHQA